jgi:SAM-dependent methyltransferase
MSDSIPLQREELTRGRAHERRAGSTVLEHPDASVRIDELPEGRMQVRVDREADGRVHSESCETSCDLETIAVVLEAVGPARLCDFLDRMEPGSSMGRLLAAQLFAYRRPEDFAGRRLLDFGSGRGASTFIMSELLPRTDFVGVELDAGLVAQAERIRQKRGATRIQFVASPSGTSLPDVGEFDFVMLSAVYEHLLPAERREVLPRIWGIMKPGAVVFVNQTPHRWFPWDHHSTGLWGINYLPAPAAQWLARFGTMNRDFNRTARTWEAHLRGGLRGGTERAILRDFTAGRSRAGRILQPIGYPDRAGYWLAQTSPRYRSLKRGIASVFRVSERLFGSIPSMNVDVVIQKVE